MPPRNVLVTGASGKLGRAVCVELAEHGHRVRATDHKYTSGLGAEPLLGDLRDEGFVYRALEGCDAVVHLGNHPNAFAGPSPQGLLADNTRMNANVIYAALDLGVRDVVFASSIQVMLPSIGNSPPPFRIPYLPIDGEAPASLGNNAYALSKAFCERLLAEAAAAHPEFAATALRFPMLVGGELLERLRSRPKVSARWLNLGEALAHLYLDEAAELVRLVLEQRRPGYRQYLPAASQQPQGLTLPELVERFYADIPLRVERDALVSLIDVSALERDFGWRPEKALAFSLDES